MTKKRTKRFVIYKNTAPMVLAIVFSALMLMFSFGCVLLPLIRDTGFARTVWCFAVGGVGIAFFCFFVFYYSLKLSYKQPALVVGNDGVAVYTIKSKAVFIPRACITAIKVFGNEKNKYMGFIVDDADSISGIENKAVKRTVFKNCSQGYPPVIISQREIKGDIKENAIKIKEILSYAAAKNGAEK